MFGIPNPAFALHIWILLSSHPIRGSLSDQNSVINKETVRPHCVYPCTCGSMPTCPAGVTVVRDGCGCCWMCSRQYGESCDFTSLCDASRNLSCFYSQPRDLIGICRETKALTCQVNDRKFQDGTTFLLDCRTKCTCQNGTYACVSLCPGESISPSSLCRDAKLISVPGQCCKEWMCNTTPTQMEEPRQCDVQVGNWTDCSATKCGVGVASRWTTNTPLCQSANETRVCQIRPCQIAQEPTSSSNAGRSHKRRRHICKATQRHSRPVHLQVGPCVSEKKFRPKYCGDCKNTCCKVQAATTLPVVFLCPLHSAPRISQATRFSSTSHGPTVSVYDVMDEGQPAYQNDQTQDDYTPIGFIRDYEVEYQENLTTEDEYLYTKIKTSSYDVVHLSVEWIIRCKCTSKSLI